MMKTGGIRKALKQIFYKNKIADKAPQKSKTKVYTKISYK